MIYMKGAGPIRKENRDDVIDLVVLILTAIATTATVLELIVGLRKGKGRHRK